MAIENDLVVAIEYQLTEEGQDVVLDSNRGADPLEFIMGKGAIIPGLEKELAALNPGDAKTVTVQPGEAYGEYDEKGLMTYPKEQFAGVELAEGLTLYGQSEDGQTVQVQVKSFDEKDVTVDYNHPLAGKVLAFEVAVLNVRAATEEELAAGYPASVMQQQSGGCCGGSSCGDESSAKESDTECCGGEKHGEEHECCGGHDHDSEKGCCSNS